MYFFSFYTEEQHPRGAVPRFFVWVVCGGESGFCEVEHLVAVFLAVLAAGDVEPAVPFVLGLAAGGFEDDLVKVGMFLKELYPTVGNGHVGMCPSVFP